MPLFAAFRRRFDAGRRGVKAPALTLPYLGGPMRRSTHALVFFCLAATVGAFAQNASVAKIRRTPFAEGCINSRTSCGSISVGQIAPGDCVDSGGERYDVWQFD